MSEKFNNPFEKLKALKKQMAPEAAPAKAPPPPPPKKEAPPKEQSPEDDAALFLKHMANTKPLRPSPHGKTIAVKKEDKRVTAADLLDLASALDDRAAWQCFDDGAGEVWHAPGVSEKLIRDFRRGAVEPQATLDLHGLRAQVAERAVDNFIREQAEKGASAALIITGKGEHSQGDAVLRNALVDWLRKPNHLRRLLAYCAAPRSLGGEGATLVALRRRLG
jgi:DNA-nicking Smr family endonuclease